MYETGIAHTLGKTVIPITQSLDDIPSDLGHHRALKYLPNDEGYRTLSNELYKRIKTILSVKKIARRITAADTLRSGLAPSLGLKAHCPPSRFLRRKKTRRR